MCNLYRMTQVPDEVARWFGALNGAAGANYAAEVYPGYPGLVVAEGQLRPMVWGVPLPQKGKNGKELKPKPVNNARTDKLTSPFWRASFHDRRCLIPVTAWAEAEGEVGAKTRTWLSRPDASLFAVAGLWRWSKEWGEGYAMVMTEAGGAAARLHSRMPVLLAKDDHAAWTDGSADEALALCRPWDGELILDATRDAWSGGGQRLLL